MSDEKEGTKAVATSIAHGKTVMEDREGPYQEVTIIIELPKKGNPGKPRDVDASVDGRGRIVVTGKVPPDDW